MSNEVKNETFNNDNLRGGLSDTTYAFASSQLSSQQTQKTGNGLTKEELLFQACLRGNPDQVSYWLEQGADANAQLRSEFSRSKPKAHPIVTPLIGIAKSQTTDKNKIEIAKKLINHGADVNYISELNINSPLPFQGVDTVLNVCGKSSLLGEYLVKEHNAKTSEELRKNSSFIELLWQEKYSKARKRDGSNTSSNPNDYKHRKENSKIPTRLTTETISEHVAGIRNILDLPKPITIEVLRRAEALEEIEQLNNKHALINFCGNMTRFRPILASVIKAELLKLPEVSKNQAFFQPALKSSNVKKNLKLQLDQTSLPNESRSGQVRPGTPRPNSDYS